MYDSIDYVHEYSTPNKKSSPIPESIQLPKAKSNIGHSGFRYVSGEYDNDHICVKDKNIHIENSRAIFEEIEKDRSSMDLQIDLFFGHNNSNSVQFFL